MPKKRKLITITLGDFLGSYLTLRPSAIWLVLSWMVTYSASRQKSKFFNFHFVVKTAAMHLITTMAFINLWFKSHTMSGSFGVDSEQNSNISRIHLETSN